jgi:hypothetical protein
MGEMEAAGIGPYGVDGERQMATTAALMVKRFRS